MCPGAPFLVDGVADAVAARLPDLRNACRRALALLPPADAVLLVSAGPAVTGARRAAAGPGWRMLPAGAVISASSIVRSDHPTNTPRTAGPAAATIVEPGVGTIVGSHLLAADIGVRTPVVIVEISGDPGGAADAARQTIADVDRAVLLVVADGAACHGDDAPGRRDDRAAAFDATLATALDAGNPAALAAACADRTVAAELLAIVDPLAVLAGLIREAPPDDAELLFDAAPFGVGYLVASWRWRDR